MTTAWSDAAFATLLPRPRLSVSQWAEAHRVIPRGTSPEAGPWRTDRVPYLREPMDAVSDPAVERVVLQAASQVAKTELLLNVIGYYADQDPSPILLIQPTDIAAQAFSKERLEPTFRESPALQGKLADGLRDSKNTIYLRQFPGGYLALGWATSSVSLASRPIRVVLGDELDKWPDAVGHDGDPWPQAVQRTSNFHNRKIIAVSTPTVDGISRIAGLYEDSDQRRLWVPCPRCGAYQVLRWEGVRYKGPDGEVRLDDVHYRCEHCQGRIEERDRPSMLALCEWRADNPGHPHRGYQLSALYSPWVPWRTLAVEWIRAWKNRDRRGQQEFVNLRLGETWREAGDEIHVEALDKNREDYEAEVPAGVLLLTVGVDVQDDRLEVEIVGWGLGRESWGIHYAVLPGDTSTDRPWADLDLLLARPWKRESGHGLVAWSACIDSGGHRTTEVYRFCREHSSDGHGGGNIRAVKGRGGPGIPIAGKAAIIGQERTFLHHVGVDAAKEALFSRLILPSTGPGYCHFPRAPPTGYDGEYFRGLVSERRIMKMRAGRREATWKQIYGRNEPLDCRVYATAAMELLNPDFAALAAIADAPPVVATKQQGRRVYSKGVEW